MTFDKDLKAIQEHLDAARVYSVMGGPRALFRYELRVIAKRAIKLWWRSRGKDERLA